MLKWVFLLCADLILNLWISKTFGIHQADGQITGWAETGGADATIDSASGSMTVAPKPENSQGTLFTVVATSTGTGTGYAFTGDGNPGNVADTTITAGVVTLASAASMDYETNKVLVFKVVATESAHTGTATVTLPIADVDDVSPTFHKQIVAACVANGATSGTQVISVSATDPDSATLTFTITNGDAKTDFGIANNGSVTVAKTLNATAMPGYSLEITASDGTNTADTCSLIVYVGDCGVRCDNNNNNGGHISTHSISILMTALLFFKELFY